jgi:hypothetical protein
MMKLAVEARFMVFGLANFQVLFLKKPILNQAKQQYFG